MKNKIIALGIIAMLMLAFTGCDQQADRVSSNISQAADNFNVIRRLVVINVRTDKPLFELVSAFSLKVDSEDKQLEITCETGKNEYKKHFIGINQWVTYYVEDISGASVSKYKYEVNYQPDMINPLTITSKD